MEINLLKIFNIDAICCNSCVKNKVFYHRYKILLTSIVTKNVVVSGNTRFGSFVRFKPSLERIVIL